LPSLYRHFLVGREPPVFSAVQRLGPVSGPVRETPHTEQVVQSRHLNPPPGNLQSHRLGDPPLVEVENSSPKQSSQNRPLGVRRREGVLDLARSAAPLARARPRSLPFDLKPPTEEEVLVASKHSPASPQTFRGSTHRLDQYPAAVQATASTPLVRRRAVSYRKCRPLIPSAPRQGQQRITTAPTQSLPQISSPPSQQQSLTPQRVWSFCKEEFSSSPLAEQVTSAGRSQSLADPEGRPLRVGGRNFSVNTCSSSIVSDVASPAQEQESGATTSGDLQSSELFENYPPESSPPGDHRIVENPEGQGPSLSSLAAFDFGFDKEAPEKPSRSHWPDCCKPSNSPVAAHPNLAGFKFSVPTVQSSQKETSELVDSVEPSLPAPTSVLSDRAPRGLSSALHQIRRKFEPKPRSAPAGHSSVRSTASAIKDVVPRLGLPPFPRPSLGLGDKGIEEEDLGTIAKGKGAQPQRMTLNPHQPSRNMDFLHPESAMAMTEHRREAIRMAKTQEAAVVEKCKRSGAAAPGFSFDELIGKGSFGRVYKG
jgi:hypothetical protein